MILRIKRGSDTTKSADADLEDEEGDVGAVLDEVEEDEGDARRAPINDLEDEQNDCRESRDRTTSKEEEGYQKGEEKKF